jgi:hypothetical protein
MNQPSPRAVPTANSQRGIQKIVDGFAGEKPEVQMAHAEPEAEPELEQSASKLIPLQSKNEFEEGARIYVGRRIGGHDNSTLRPAVVTAVDWPLVYYQYEEQEGEKKEYDALTAARGPVLQLDLPHLGPVCHRNAIVASSAGIFHRLNRPRTARPPPLKLSTEEAAPHRGFAIWALGDGISPIGEPEASGWDTWQGE